MQLFRPTKSLIDNLLFEEKGYGSCASTCILTDHCSSFRCTRPLLQRVGYRSPSGNEGEEVETSSTDEKVKEETVVDWTTKPPPEDLVRRKIPSHHLYREDSTPSGLETQSTSMVMGEEDHSSDILKMENECGRKLLRDNERKGFVNAIVKEKLKELALRDGKDTTDLDVEREDKAKMEALQYQAHIEITWIEDWAWNHPISPQSGGLGQGSATVISEDELRQRRLLVKRALLELIDYKKPLPYIIGTHPFYGCFLHCRPPVMCPQGETEMWTHWLIERLLKPVLLPGTGGMRVLDSREENKEAQIEKTMITPIRVLDMCCGTGCVGIALAKHLPLCSVVGVDLDSHAVELAALNAEVNGIPLHATGKKGRYLSVQGNMFAALHDAEGERNGMFSIDHLAQEYHFGFDILVCNPPYLFPEEYADLPSYEQYWLPKLAVLGDPEREGAKQYRYFKELCDVGWQILRRKKDQDVVLHDIPNFVVEVGQQATLVATMMEKAVDRVTGIPLWKDVELHLDFNQQPRWISARSVH